VRCALDMRAKHITNPQSKSAQRERNNGSGADAVGSRAIRLWTLKKWVDRRERAARVGAGACAYKGPSIRIPWKGQTWQLQGGG